MVYKKYIIKNGKTYGPYIYHSKRVNGKVISEYRGQTNKFDYKLLLFIILGIVLVFSVFYLLFSANKTLVGRVTLGIDANYIEGQPLTGNIRLTLKEGELLPIDSKIVFESEKNIFEYDLKDVVAENKLIREGSFYVEGKDISGEGEGYGVAGTKESYPNVSFTLRILTQATSEEKPEKETNETPTENSTEETGETTNETPAETPVTETPVETPSGGTETPTETPSETPTETTPATETPTESPLEKPSGKEETTSTPVTGSIISRILQGTAKFFMGLTGTGRVSMELGSEVSATTSKDNPYTYKLSEGQTAEIVSSSQNVDLVQEGDIVSVTTKYSEQETGFGADYLGKNTETLTVDLSKMNLTLDPGRLDIKLIYKDTEILTLSTNLSEGAVSISNETEVIENIGNLTRNETLTNITTNVSNITTIYSNFSLTDNEKQILIEEFGNITINVTKAERVNGRILIRYELGKYWAEFSYNSADDLNSSMERDRIKWLKDLANSLSEAKKSNTGEQLENYIENYSI